MTFLRPRIAIAGIAIESSTFTPYRSGVEDFEIRRGTTEILARYPFFSGTEDPGSSPGPPAALDGGAGGSSDSPAPLTPTSSGRALLEAAEYIGVFHARALPGGQLDRETYEMWKTEIVDGLAAARAEGPLDGFFFDIHGAMSVTGLDDAEGDLISAIRSVIGSDPVVGTAMDLHGNVSETLFEACDLLTCYRHAPHIDAWETRERGLRDLVDAARTVAEGGALPHKALVHLPILLPGEMTSTRIEPAKSLYGMIPELTRRDGVTDVSYWIGFAWADQPRCKAAIVAFGDDAHAVQESALELATAVWQKRHDFEFVAPTGTLDECLDRAIASESRPFWISDSGDNPGAGGADDTTYALAKLLERPEIRDGTVSAAMISLVDPESAQVATQLGVGGQGDFTVGGRIDSREPGPVPLRAEVQALDDAPNTGRSAALRVLHDGRETGLTVVVTQRRSQWATRSMFARLGLSMTGFDIVVIKMGYLEPDQYEAAADWLLALTPGGVDQDLLRLGHERIDRPMIPFDPEIPAPTAASVITGGGPDTGRPASL